jgi:L-lactate dehydrogenase complex protein LldG
MYTRLATHPVLFTFSQRLAGLGARLVTPLSEWMKFPAFTGWGYSKDFPRPAIRPFRDKWSEIIRGDTQFTEKKEKKEEVSEIPQRPKFELVPRFIEELTALGGHVIRTTEGEISNQLIALLREKNVARVQTWESVSGVDWDAITSRGISVQADADQSIKAGITGALAGIAETGTLVIQSGKGRLLTASLLPEIHIAVLQASDIEGSLEKVLTLRKVETFESVVLVSGPSRTADIEMTLTIGVHGPGELYVFILE